MTQSVLAEKINKSVPTVSKYEKGEIEIGLEVLIDICNILKLNIYTIIPATALDGNEEVQGGKNQDRFYRKLYLYFLSEKKNKIVCGVLENNLSAMQSTFHFGVKDVQNFFKSDFLYNGRIICNDTGNTFFYQNADPPFDTISIRLPSLAKRGEPRIGSMTTISFFYQSISLKVVASETPITDEDYLYSKLQISSEELKYIKRTNFFVVF